MIDLPGGDHHDFTVTPQGIAYLAKEERGGFDKIFTARSDGSDARVFFDLKQVIDAYPKVGGPGTEQSHFNSIHYYRERDEYTVSNRESDAIVTISGDGRIKAGVGRNVAPQVFPTWAAEGAEDGEANGMPQLWRVQHGHDLYAENKLLVFSNGDFVGGQAHVLHYTMSADHIAHLDWSYMKMGNSSTQGDVQMLRDDHVLVCAGNAGLLQELDENQNIVASYRAPNGGFGYVMHRDSLYGAPPDGR